MQLYAHFKAHVAKTQSMAASPDQGCIRKSLIWERDGPPLQEAEIRALWADSEFTDKMG